MKINDIHALVDQEFTAVNQFIDTFSVSHEVMINHMITHLIHNQGKRLRPLIVLLACHACGYQGKEHIKLAAMIEFFHTATLLHDDVIDDSHLRRGTQTTHELWGSKASILVGDYLFTRYMQLMIEVGDLTIMRRLSTMSYEVGCGELKQLTKKHTDTLSREDYFDIIKSKTSLLFAISAELGAMISQQSSTVQTALYTYGLHLGNAFQLTDDALDYSSSSSLLGKNIGDDFMDGKLTMPLLHALETGTAHQKAWIKTHMTTPDKVHLNPLITLLEDTGSLEYTQTLAKKEGEAAIRALALIKDSPYKTALSSLAQYAYLRDH